jgi:hypothetical protein
MEDALPGVDLNGGALHLGGKQKLSHPGEEFQSGGHDKIPC